MRIEAGFTMRWWFSRYTEDWNRIAAEPKSRAVAISNRHFPTETCPAIGIQRLPQPAGGIVEHRSATICTGFISHSLLSLKWQALHA